MRKPRAITARLGRKQRARWRAECQTCGWLGKPTESYDEVVRQLAAHKEEQHA